MFTLEAVLLGIWFHLQNKPLPSVGAFCDVIVDVKNKKMYPELLAHVDIRKIHMREGDLIAEGFLNLAKKRIILFEHNSFPNSKTCGSYIIQSGLFNQVYNSQLAIHFYNYQSQLRELANLVAQKHQELEN